MKKPKALFVRYTQRPYDRNSSLLLNPPPAQSVVVDSMTLVAERYLAPELPTRPQFVVIDSQELLQFVGVNEGRCQWLQAVLANAIGSGYFARYCASYRGPLYPVSKLFIDEIYGFCKKVPGFTIETTLGDLIDPDNLDLIAFEITQNEPE